MCKVIVAITTYNLEKYIAEALDSVLAQKTDFLFKIIIADDCSTDRTVEIICDYQKKYPDMIELLLSDKNMGSLANSNRMFDGIECEYFSFLDGDDYWVDENRLQKQVDFMDRHLEYMLCAGNTQYLRGGNKGEYLLKHTELDRSYCFNDFLCEKMPFFHTSSILVRNTIFCNGLPKCYTDAEETFENCALRGEDFRRLIHLEKGPLYAFDELYSVYRIHEKGIWQGSNAFKRGLESAIGANFYAKYFGEKYGDFFLKKKCEQYRKIMKMLIIDKNLLNEYDISEKENELILSYLNDIRGIKTSCSNDKMRRFITRVYIKLCTWLDKM